MFNDSVYIFYVFFVFLKEQEKTLYKPFRSFFCSVPKIIFEFLAHKYGISTNLYELIKNFYISYYILRQIRHIFLNKFTQFAIFNTSFSNGGLSQILEEIYQKLMFNRHGTK